MIKRYMLLMMGVAMLLFASCSSSNDSEDKNLPEISDGSGGVSSSNLTGHWENSDYYMDETFSFNTKGTNSIVYEYSYDNDEVEQTVIASGTYTINGNVLTANYTKVDVYKSDGGNYLKGFTNDEKLMVKYTVVSIGAKTLTMTDENEVSYPLTRYEGYEPGEDNDDNGNNGNTTTSKLDYRNLTYCFEGDGRIFKMVRVEGSNFRPFYIMQTEVPIHSYIRFGNTEFIAPLDRDGDNIVLKSEFRTFLDSIRSKTGLDFRIPSTAEWLYAAKGGNKSKGYKYCGSNNIDDVAWYKDNSSYVIHDVALKMPNELGLYDMSGNYAEVTSSDTDIYTIDGNNCGGSWKHVASKCLPDSWEADPVSGKMPGTKYKNKNAIDSRYISVRLIYLEPEK